MEVNCASFQRPLPIFSTNPNMELACQLGLKLIASAAAVIIPLGNWLPHCFISDDGERLSAPQWTRAGFCVIFPVVGGTLGPRGPAGCPLQVQYCTKLRVSPEVRRFSATQPHYSPATGATAIARQAHVHGYHCASSSRQKQKKNVCEPRLKYSKQVNFRSNSSANPGLGAAGSDGSGCCSNV